MFDLKWIRENPEKFDNALVKRHLPPHSAEILALDEDRRAHVAKLQEAQTRRNAASKEIGRAKSSGDEKTAQALIDEVADLKTEIQDGEEEERRLSEALNDILSSLPNRPLDDVPVGKDEEANLLVRQVGEPPEFAFEAKQHFEIGEALGLMDFETAAKLSGARFVVLKGLLARLERALAAFMLDLHTDEFGYREIAPPFLVRDATMFGTAQLPKFADDQFRTEDGFWLIPTAEVPLTNLVRENIVDEDELPLRFTAYTPCFRLEAGAAGKDTRGMIRQHQFSKVELVSIAHPDQSLEEHERMTSCAEEVLKRLKLPYQVIVLSTGDMGFAARKTYDIEVWLPGQNMYREISSCSVCGDFQARRMNTRFRVKDAKDLRFVHTLNGSGLAVGRTMVAILENYQQEDGSVLVPEILRPYLGSAERITAS
ncbi:serine--tRNA ligase [bacterium MnTg02]|nr:serine--tRNA ligase [bacterium MnTg02]